MNQKQLEIFLAVARTLNFTKAAEQLFMSQTTVTLQIKSLEEFLEVRLFERSSRNVRLTAAGKVFRDGAVRLLHQMSQLVYDTQSAACGFAGVLNIGIAAGASSTEAADRIRDFTERHPEIQMLVHGSYPGEALLKLRSDIYDIIIIPALQKDFSQDFSFCSLGFFSLVAAFHKKHAFSRRDVLSPRDFEGTNLLYVSPKEEEFQFSQHFMEKICAQDINLKVVSRTDNIESILFMLDANLAVTVLPEYFSGRFNGESQLMTRPIEGMENAVEFLAVWKTRIENPVLGQFTDFLQHGA